MRSSKNKSLILCAILFSPLLHAEERAAKINPEPTTWSAFRRLSNQADIAIAQKIEAAHWWDSCARFGRSSRSKKETREGMALRLFLKKERHLNAVDYANIPLKKIGIGMTQCGIFGSIGLPASSNRTQYTNGTRHQLIYNTPKRYIYTEENDSSRTGIVVTIQD